MTCSACGRANLPGGVRCIYCGVPFPSAPDFEVDLGVSAPDPAAAGEAVVAERPDSQSRRTSAGLLGGLVLLLLKAKSLLALLKLGPLLTTFGTMWLFVAAEARLFGWQLAVGLTVSIFLHEMGHVVMNWRHGLKCSAPMFIPFFGAVITVKQFPEDPQVEAECGAGGPAAGFVVALACVALGAATGHHFWYGVAFLGFLINLFNMTPFGPLDGSRMATALSPGNWDFVLISMLLIVLKVPSGLLWAMLIVLFLLRLGRGSHAGRYHLALPAARARIALLYLVLVVGLSVGIDHTRAVGARFAAESRQEAAGQTVDAERPATARPAAAPAEPAAEPAPSQDERAVIRGIVQAAVLIAVALAGILLLAALPLTGLLLAKAAGEGFGRQGLLYAGGMLVPLVVLYTAPRLGIHWREPIDLLGGYAAAVAAGFIYSAYAAYHAPSGVLRPLRRQITWRCLAWSAGAALLVAYWSDSMWVAGAVALCALVFYARRPWLAACVAARLRERLGDLDRAIAWRRRALALRPDAEAAEDIRQELAVRLLTLGRGEEAAGVLVSGGTAPVVPPLPTSLSGARLRGAALAEMDRHDEALAECERLLRTTSGDRTGPLRLLWTRQIIARVALSRAWPDEAAAQAACIARSVNPMAGPLARGFLADSHYLRARALATEGRAKDAEREVAASQRWLQEPWSDSTAAALRAEAELNAGRPDSAASLAESALRRLPGALWARYLHGRALHDAGRTDEGESVLKGLAESHPRDHWGILAAEALARATA